MRGPGGAAYGAASQRQLTAEALMPSRLDPAEMARAGWVGGGVGTGPRHYSARRTAGIAVVISRRNSAWCGRHRCPRVGVVDRGRATAAGAAIGRHVAAERGPRRAGRGNRSPAAPARRTEERRQGAHGSAASGGVHHRGDEGGRGGLATPPPAPLLVLRPRDVEFPNRKPTAIGRLRAAVPTPLTGRS